MPKHKVSQPEPKDLNKKARLEAAAWLHDILDDAQTLLDHAQACGTAISSKLEGLEQLLTNIRSSPKTGGSNDPFTKMTKTAGYSVTKATSWLASAEPSDNEVVGFYDHLDTANKVALMEYKNIHREFDWRVIPIVDLGIYDVAFNATTMIERIKDMDTSSGWLMSRAGEHQYLYGTDCGKVVRISVQAKKFWGEATVQRSEDAASDLPWKITTLSPASG